MYAVGVCMYQYENDTRLELFKDMFVNVSAVHEYDMPLERHCGFSFLEAPSPVQKTRLS